MKKQPLWTAREAHDFWGGFSAGFLVAVVILLLAVLLGLQVCS